MWIATLIKIKCLLEHIIEGNINEDTEVTRRQGIRRKQLLNDLKENKGYWKLEEEALYRTLRRTRFRRVFGLVVRQTTEWMNEWDAIWRNE
jgi:hypothetical protein